MTRIVKLSDHEANCDPTALCVTRGRGPAIYRCSAGFVVSVGRGYAVEGCFATLADASAAQQAWEGSV